MNELKLRILDQLLQHLEGLDANELRPKPKEGELQVTAIGVKPKDALEGDAGEKGPMEKLMEEKAETPEQEAAEPKDDDDEVSDDELEELLKEHLK
jgi:hypothetical protein